MLKNWVVKDKVISEQVKVINKQLKCKKCPTCNETQTQEGEHQDDNNIELESQQNEQEEIIPA